MLTVIGIETTSFKADDGSTINGTRLYCTKEKDNIVGLAVESIYCASKVDLDFVEVGSDIDVLYNKYGKVAKVNVLE